MKFVRYFETMHSNLNNFNDISVMCTPKADLDFCTELRRAIHERNLLTIKTRTKLLLDLDKMTTKNNEEKLESMRIKALEEIYSSEKSYLQQLEKLIKYFMIPMKSLNFLPQTDFNTIFGNIETIYNVNGELLKELKENVENAASALLKLAPYFKLYSFYAYDYKKAISILQSLENNSPEFKKFLEEQESCTDVQMKLPALLITPIQRIPRYRLLLKQVLEHTVPTHPHYEKLLESLKEVEHTAEHINSLVEEHDNIERMLELQKSLQNNYPCIIKPGRRLIKEGTLIKMSRKRNRGFPRYFVLMSDILMYCKIINGNPRLPNALQCCCILPLNKCKVEEMLKTSSFKLTCQHESFVLYSNSSKNTEDWILTIRRSIFSYVECRKTLRKDSSRRQPVRKKCDIDLDYLGLSPSFFKQKRKFQDFDDIFYAHADENAESKRKYFPFRVKKRPLSTDSNIVQQTPIKKVRISDEITIVPSKLSPEDDVATTSQTEADCDENSSKLYNLFCRVRNSVRRIFNFN